MEKHAAMLLVVLLAASTTAPAAAARQARVGGPERTLLAGCRTGLWVDNKCDHTVLLAVSSLLEDDAGMKDDYCRNGIVLPNVVTSEYKEWCTRAWFEFEPNDGGYVTFTNNRFVFIYARIKEDSSYSWRGESSDEPWLDVDTGKVCSESSSASTCKHFKKLDAGEGCPSKFTYTMDCSNHEGDTGPGTKPGTDPPSSSSGQCHIVEKTIAWYGFGGNCVAELVTNVLDVESAAACCNQCVANKQCNMWAWCDPSAATGSSCTPTGLGGHSLPGDCVLLQLGLPTGTGLQLCAWHAGDSVTWTSGVVPGREFASS